MQMFASIGCRSIDGGVDGRWGGGRGVVWELRDMELEIACDVFVDELVVGLVLMVLVRLPVRDPVM